MPFIPHTKEDIEQMLQELQLENTSTLFDEIPDDVRFTELLDIPVGMNELEVTRLLTAKAKCNSQQLNFVGAGAYEHHIPAAVWEITGRGEFMTAYTPYQSEASQGTLQLIYEFQSMMTGLTGMEVANASLYDGATGLAESVLMAIRSQRKVKSKRILMPCVVHPRYRETVHSLVHQQEIELVDCPFDASTGLIDQTALKESGHEPFSALVIPFPNFFGGLDEVDQLTDWAHQQGALVVAVVNPVALGLLKAPGNWGDKGADIVCGELQPFGMPLAFGGPYAGFMCCKQELVRQMPGRIVGRTNDADGQKGYVLTLQAREQHIRRSKATSNICTNQGLLVTAATIHMSLMGPAGIKAVALSSHHNTAQLLIGLQEAGAEVVFSSPYFHEAVVRIPGKMAEALKALSANGIIAGLPLEADYPQLKDCILVCATEIKTKEDIDSYCKILKAVMTETAGVVS